MWVNDKPINLIGYIHYLCVSKCDDEMLSSLIMSTTVWSNNNRAFMGTSRCISTEDNR